MARLNIDIPDAVVARVTDAYAATFGWQATINGAANPETKVEFTRRKLRENIMEVVATYEARKASETARAKATTEIVVT